MYNLFGFVIAVFFIKTALSTLNVNSNFYVDEVAMLIVFGGTLAALVSTFPPRYLIKFLSAPWKMLRKGRRSATTSIELLVKASTQQGGQKAYLKSLMKDPSVDSFLKEGIDLLLLGMKREDFKNILTERIYRIRQRDEEIVSLYRKLSKYPPAFGLVGTVLGLISLMRSVGQGADASSIGLNMALALTATLYGLAFSNFVLAPVAENFQCTADEKKIFNELLFEGLIMIHDEMEPLSIQEMLNSYVDPEQRVDVLAVREKEAS